MPTSEYMKVEVGWLDEEGLLMSAEEFAFYIRGPWRLARDLGKSELLWQTSRGICAVRASVSPKRADKLANSIAEKFSVLSWDETHKYLRIHGVSRVHVQLNRFRSGSGSEPKAKPHPEKGGGTLLKDIKKSGVDINGKTKTVDNFPPLNKLPRENNNRIYPEAFTEWWDYYNKNSPSDTGTMATAYKAFRKRMKEKVAPGEIMVATENYLAWMPFKDYTHQHASSFIGTKETWKKHIQKQAPGTSKPEEDIPPYWQDPIEEGK